MTRRATRDQAPPTTTVDDEDTRSEVIQVLGDLLIQSQQLFAAVQSARGREAYKRAWKAWDALSARIDRLSEGVDILDGRE